MDMKECIENLKRQHEISATLLKQHIEKRANWMEELVNEPDMIVKMKKLDEELKTLGELLQPLCDFFNFIESCQQARDSFAKWNEQVSKTHDMILNQISGKKGVWDRLKEVFTQ